MFSLLMLAALGQCSSHGGYSYARQSYYAAPTYYYAAPAKTYYQAPAVQYQAPQINYSLVADYLRQESAYQATVQQNAKLDVLLKLMADRPAPQPQPQPQPQFQAPYSSPQVPAKPAPTPQFEAQYPTEQQPPFATKPSPAAPPAPAPSFESSSWVPSKGMDQAGSTWVPPAQSSYGSGGGIAAMVSVMQNRCVDCHVGSSEKGGGVKLLEIDGQLAQLNDQLLTDIDSAVKSGRMPKKGGRLNNQELYAVLFGLREYAATSRARQNVAASFGQ